MNIGNAIFAILSADATLETQLGGKKIYPLKAPQKSVVPYLIYRQISSTANDTKDGVSTLDIVRVQIDIFSKNHDDVCVMGELVRTLLDKYSGTIGSVNVDSIQYLSENPDWDDDDDDFKYSADYSLRIKR